MYALVYLSKSAHNFTQPELLELLRRARDKNQRLAVTGLLLYKDGNFMQMLEGDQETVLALFHEIRNDPRHTNVITLLDEPAGQRHFPDWSMALKDLRHVNPAEVPGYSDFLNAPLTPAEFSPNPHRALRLLDLFKTT